MPILTVKTVYKFIIMKAQNYFKTIFLLAFAFILSSAVIAQDAKPTDAPPPEAQRPAMKQFQDRHADFLHRLGLTEEQLQQIRKIHQEKKPLMEDAQKRLREATRVLNEAIYSDQVSEGDIQARLSDRQLAQAEVEKLRFMNEFAVRRLLTQEQLVRFRELRQQFEKLRKVLETRRRGNGDRQFNRQRNKSDSNRPQISEPSAQPSTSTDQQQQNQ